MLNSFRFLCSNKKCSHRYFSSEPKIFPTLSLAFPKCQVTSSVELSRVIEYKQHIVYLKSFRKLAKLYIFHTLFYWREIREFLENASIFGERLYIVRFVLRYLWDYLYRVDWFLMPDRLKIGPSMSDIVWFIVYES